MEYSDLKEYARELGINPTGKKKDVLIGLIETAEKAKAEGNMEFGSTSEHDVQKTEENIDDILSQADEKSGAGSGSGNETGKTDEKKEMTEEEKKADAEAKKAEADAKKAKDKKDKEDAKAKEKQDKIDAKAKEKKDKEDAKAKEKKDKEDEIAKKKAEKEANKGTKLSDEATNIDISNVPIQVVHREKLIPSKMNFFKPLTEQKMRELVDSIKKNGVIVPLIVRPIADTDTFEILAGENRWKASAEDLANKEFLPVRIIEVSDDKAKEVMVDTNYTQRDSFSPMELAKIFQEKGSIIGKRQGKRTDIDGGGDKGSTRDIIAKDYKVSGMTVDRYMRLNNLIPEFVKAVDEEKLSVKAGMEIGMLDEDSQKVIFAQKKDDLANVSATKIALIRETVKDKNSEVNKEEVKKQKKEGTYKPISATVEDVNRAFKAIDSNVKALKISVVVPDDFDAETREFIEGNVITDTDWLLNLIKKYVHGKIKEVK